MIDFKELLETAIKKEIEERKSRERSGKFTPSRMGRCFRFQYWQRIGEPESDPIPMSVYKVFRAGNIYHKDLESLIENTEVEFENEHFKCISDHVGKDYIVDFKTVSSRQFKFMQNKDYDITEKKLYIFQLMTYCYFFEKPYGILVFVNKDTYEILQFTFYLKEHINSITKEIETLLGFWERKELPPPEPRAYGGKECQYCSFRSKCKDLEGEK